MATTTPPPPPPNNNTLTPPLSTVTTKQTPTSTPLSHVVIIPTHSRWFSWNKIHECEVKFLPEFFEGRSVSKNPRVYKYYRNAIIGRFRENPNRKVSFTEVRKTIIGDVGSVRRIFDFLESWGLINYFGSPFTNKQLNQQKWEDKESSSNSKGSGGGGAAGSAVAVSDGNIVEKRRLCSTCKSVCSVACFTCDKDDLTLCARCFVRGNYKVGVTSSDFKRVEISDEVKKDWTDKETLHLLEAVMHFHDDWKRVAEHVGGRTARECVAQFVKLPFGEQFIGLPDSSLVDDTIRQPDGQSNNELALRSTMVPLSKRMRLTPLADASNPIMAQAAFLSALVGVDVAQAAAHAAFVSLYEGYNGTGKKESLSGTKQQESVVSSNGNTASTNALEEAQLQVEREEDSIEQAISSIIDVQMNEIQEKIVRFEEFDLQVEKKFEQLEQMKNLLFVDQLNLLFHKSAEPKSRESMEKVLKIS